MKSLVLTLLLTLVGCATTVHKPLPTINPAHNDTIPTQAYSPDKHCNQPGFGTHAYYLSGMPYPIGDDDIFLFCW